MTGCQGAGLYATGGPEVIETPTEKATVARRITMATELVQYAALPYVLVGGRPLVCLVTSRETRRWIIPKGWPKAGAPEPAVASNEALEEAGVAGTISAQALGSYEYRKKLHVFAYAACQVFVYALHVDHQLRDWPERRQRRLAWLEPLEAARRVSERGLADLISGFGASGAERARRPAGEQSLKGGFPR